MRTAANATDLRRREDNAHHVHIREVVARKLSRVRFLRRPAEPEVQVRALADYDAALGVDGGVA